MQHDQREYDIQIDYEGDEQPGMESAISKVLGSGPDDVERDDYHELVWYVYGTKSAVKRVMQQLMDLAARSPVPLNVRITRSADQADLEKIRTNTLTPADIQRMRAAERL